MMLLRRFTRIRQSSALQKFSSVNKGYRNFQARNLTQSAVPSSGLGFKPTLKLLIVECYPNDARDDMLNVGGIVPSDLYINAVKKLVPKHLDVEIEIVYAADDQFNPEHYDTGAFDGCVFTGSSFNIYEMTPPIQRMVKFTEKLFNQGMPLFGSCWALQLGTVAAGGVVQPNPLGPEFFLSRKIRLTSAGQSHPMYEGKPFTFSAFTIHDDEVAQLPRAGIHLAENYHSMVQAAAGFRGHRGFWAVQYHPEYHLKAYAKLLLAREKKLLKFGFFKSETKLKEFCEELLAIHDDPIGNKDLAWKLGIDDDILLDDIRLCEPRNWIRQVVIPYASLRHSDRLFTPSPTSYPPDKKYL
eukprot:g1386.t1